MWLLVDEGTDGVDGEDVPSALCVDIDGLFIDFQRPTAADTMRRAAHAWKNCATSPSSAIAHRSSGPS
jgi:hypothetical protein